MEEDIKKAKNIIEYCRNEMNFNDVGNVMLHKDIANIIENLINKNKELEDKNRHLEEKLERRQINIEEYRKYREAYYSIQYMIPKSKLIEALEELDNMKVEGEVFTTAVNFAKKEIKELLGDDK